MKSYIYIFTTFFFSACNKIENTKLMKSENESEYSNISNNPSTVKYSKENFIKKNFEETLKKILDDIYNQNKDKKETSRNNFFKEEIESISTEKNIKDSLLKIFSKSLEDKFENSKKLFEIEIKSKFFCKCNETKEEYIIEKNFGIEISLEDYCRYLNVEESIKTKKFECDKCKKKEYSKILEITPSEYIAVSIQNFKNKYFELVHYRCIKINDDTFCIKDMIGYDSKNENFKEEDLFDRNYSTPVFLIYEKKEKEKKENNKKYSLNYLKGENPYCTGKNKLPTENSSARINTKNLSLKEISNILSSKEAQEYLNTKQKTVCTFSLPQNKSIEKRTKIFEEKSPIKNIQSTISNSFSSIKNSILKITTTLKKESISEENPTLENIKPEDINISSNQKNKKSPCCYATEIRFDESVTREEIENVLQKDNNLEKSILWNFIYLNHENLNKKVYGDRIATLDEIIRIFEYIFENPEKKLSLLEKLIVSGDSMTENNQKYFYCIKFSIEETHPILYFGKVKGNEIRKDYIHLMVRDMKEEKEKSIFCCLFSVFCCCNCCKRVYIES